VTAVIECIIMAVPMTYGPIKGTIATQIPPKMTIMDVEISTVERRIVVLLFEKLAKLPEQHSYMRSHICLMHYTVFQATKIWSSISTVPILLYFFSLA